MSDFPLPLAWSAPIGSNAYLWDAPIVRGDQILARAGSLVLGLGAADGAERWRVTLPGNDRGGQVFLAIDDLIVVDVTAPDRSQILLGVTAGGVRWQAPLGGGVIRGGAVVDQGGAIVALAAARDREVTRVTIDPASGLAARVRLPAGGATLEFAGGELIAMSPTAAVGAPGAYVLGAGADVNRVLRTGDVWTGAASAGRLLTVGARAGARHRIEVCELRSGDVRWSDTCFVDAGALDGDDAAHAVRDGLATAVVVRDAASGAIRWRAELGDVEPATITFAGSVVLVRHMIGVIVVARADGRVLGDVLGAQGFRAAVADGRLYLGGNGALIAGVLP
jgi:hypothetical protein